MITDLEGKAKFVASMGVQARLAQGKDHDTIRREVVAKAVDATRGLGLTDMDREHVVSIVQREVEALLLAEA